jgi:hypothetical protein
MNIIAGFYQSGFKGWLGKAKAEKEWEILKDSPSFVNFEIKNFQGSRRIMLHDVVRKVLGRDIENVAQQVGDCVSWGARNAVEYLMCSEILMLGDREKYRPVFAPYLYGTGRVQVGGGQLRGDGSLGSWMAEAIVKYGVLASDEEGVPQYSGSIARQWGAPPGPPNKFLEIGKKHPVKSAARIKSWDELVTALCNGYPCTVASNQGFEMEPRSDGFHAPSGQWAHQMAIVGVDAEVTDEYGLIRNSWGDVHGHLKDFNTGEDIPVGCLRVRRKTIEKMITSGEVFAFSSFEGFPEQDLPRAMFKFI